MPLTIELAAFTVREGAEPQLRAERPEMLGALRQAFPAALAAWLTKQDDGSWLDVILGRAARKPRRRRPESTRFPGRALVSAYRRGERGEARRDRIELRYVRDRP
jgi:hypothetical protein